MTIAGERQGRGIGGSSEAGASLSSVLHINYVELSASPIHQLDHLEALTFERRDDFRHIHPDDRQPTPAIVVITDADDRRVSFVVQIDLLTGSHLDLDALATLLSCRRPEGDHAMAAGARINIHRVNRGFVFDFIGLSSLRAIIVIATRRASSD